jgi:hypothetical protein
MILSNRMQPTQKLTLLTSFVDSYLLNHFII